MPASGAGAAVTGTPAAAAAVAEVFRNRLRLDRCGIVNSPWATRVRLTFDLSKPPAKQSAVIYRGGMHWSGRTSAEIVHCFDQRVDDPAAKDQQHEQAREGGQ